MVAKYPTNAMPKPKPMKVPGLSGGKPKGFPANDILPRIPKGVLLRALAKRALGPGGLALDVAELLYEEYNRPRPDGNPYRLTRTLNQKYWAISLCAAPCNQPWTIIRATTNSCCAAQQSSSPFLGSGTNVWVLGTSRSYDLYHNFASGNIGSPYSTKNVGGISPRSGAPNPAPVYSFAVQPIGDPVAPLHQCVVRRDAPGHDGGEAARGNPHSS